MPVLSEDELEVVYKTNLKRLMNMAYRCTHNRADAEALTQDAMLVLIAKVRDKKDNEEILNPGAFLCGVMKNLLGNYISASKREREFLTLLAENIPEYKSVPTTLDEILCSELSASEREILVLRFEKSLSYVEIARVLGLSEASCRVRLHRAKLHFMELYKK